MDQPGRKQLLKLKMLCDLAICSTSLLLASTLVTGPFWRKDVLLIKHPLSQFILVVAMLGSWHLCLVLAGLYRSFRLSRQLELEFSLAQGALSATFCTGVWLFLHIVAAGGQVVWTEGMSAELIFFCIIYFSFLLLARVVSHATLRFLRRRGRNLRYVLIIGTNRRALRTAESLIDNRDLGYRLAGFVDDIWQCREAHSLYESMLVGKLSSLPELLRTMALDEVIITLPVASFYDVIRRIYHECSEQGVIVRFEVSLFDSIPLRVPGHNLPLHFVTLHQSTGTYWEIISKRLLDFSVATCALVLMSPLFLLIALLIKLTSPGPVFFKQERLGLGKRRFTIYKFRTMVPDAEKLLSTVEHMNQSEGPTFKLNNDPRITRIGKFLRKTSLDELPQLINVLLSDMSLVGPRPLPLRDYEGFSEDWHRRRFSVRPGITCLWQIMGRSTIGFNRWMELDMNYIDSWSIWLDITILLRTIPVVLRGSGAV